MLLPPPSTLSTPRLMISNQFSRNGMSLKATEYNIISELEALAIMVTSKVVHLETMDLKLVKRNPIVVCQYQFLKK